MKKYRAVIAFACGLPPTLEPNRRILRRAIKRAEELKISIIAAEGALKERDNLQILLAPPEKHYTTWKFCEWVAGVIKENGWEDDDFLAVAEPDHVDRCIRDLKWLGISAEDDGYFKANGEHFYDVNSEQWWTRYRYLNLCRERIVRCLPFWLYFRIAG